MTGIVILCVALVAATAFGLWRRATDGRMHDVRPVPDADDAPPGQLHIADRGQHGGDVLTAAALGTSVLGSRATFVQFSSAFCAPCRATRVVLADVAATNPGVVHVDIDAESHLDLVRALDIRRTPTVLVLDARGVIRQRASGATRKADALHALDALHEP